MTVAVNHASCGEAKSHVGRHSCCIKDLYTAQSAEYFLNTLTLHTLTTYISTDTRALVVTATAAVLLTLHQDG
jgi:hypothetical protein